jgi:hypothetical protein
MKLHEAGMLLGNRRNSRSPDFPDKGLLCAPAGQGSHLQRLLAQVVRQLRLARGHQLRGLYQEVDALCVWLLCCGPASGLPQRLGSHRYVTTTHSETLRRRRRSELLGNHHIVLAQHTARPRHGDDLRSLHLT